MGNVIFLNIYLYYLYTVRLDIFTIENKFFYIINIFFIFNFNRYEYINLTVYK